MSQHDEERWLLTKADIAQICGVTPQQVTTWYDRRERNDFPEPVEQYRRGTKLFGLWDYVDVVTWKLNYVPRKGGAPRGSRNGRSREHNHG